MAIYLCYGCDQLMDSDDGCYKSILAELRERGEKAHQCVCDDCHEAELEATEGEPSHAK